MLHLGYFSHKDLARRSFVNPSQFQMLSRISKFRFPISRTPVPLMSASASFSQNDRFAVLIAGHATEFTQKTYGGYGTMFKNLLGDPGETWDMFAVVEGKFPGESDLASYKGFVITGSRHDAHADEEWILKLCNMLQRLHREQKKILGVCFGHQVLSRALGGESGRAPVGWEIGLRQVDLNGEILKKPYAAQVPPHLKVLQSHQDQVLVLPPGGVLLGSSPRTPIEMFAVGNHVLGIQGHPEFTSDVLLDIINGRLAAGVLMEQEASAAKQTLNSGKDDKEIFQQLCKAFLKN